MLRLREASGAGMDPSPTPPAWEGLRATFCLLLVRKYRPKQAWPTLLWPLMSSDM